MSDISIRFSRNNNGIECEAKGMDSSEQIQFVADTVPLLTSHISRITGPWTQINFLVDRDKIGTVIFDVGGEPVRRDHADIIGEKPNKSRVVNDNNGNIDLQSEEARASLIIFLRDWCLKWRDNIQPKQDSTLNGLIRVAKQIAIGDSYKKEIN